MCCKSDRAPLLAGLVVLFADYFRSFSLHLPLWRAFSHRCYRHTEDALTSPYVGRRSGTTIVIKDDKSCLAACIDHDSSDGM